MMESSAPDPAEVDVVRCSGVECEDNNTPTTRRFADYVLTSILKLGVLTYCCSGSTGAISLTNLSPRQTASDRFSYTTI